ncbi:YcaO-like family protein [Lysinibacillus sp. Ag94]|uniref:YcaO-like family protein n=1 Tax=Lysinibacillus sp. Ag94 TaxID=2936682 RepID=UPI00200C9932|nr:YcaO-like family protein [Lysinibacillus sp. Ag94]UPW83543.1 YcaO-like family protein [Lysinibacillus sp. Ag94]
MFYKKDLIENIYKTFVIKNNEVLEIHTDEDDICSNDCITLVSFLNVVISYKRDADIPFCPSCLIYYLLDERELIDFIEKYNEDAINYYKPEIKQIVSIVNENLYEDNLLIIDSESYSFKVIEGENFIKHFLCKCNSQKKIGEDNSINFNSLKSPIGVIRNIDHINLSIKAVFKNYFFEDHFVFFSYYYHPLSLINKNYFPIDMSIGIDMNEEIAKTKAIMESLERFCVFLPVKKNNNEKFNLNAMCIQEGENYSFNKGNSNGVAAHTTINDAKTSALCEILERDAVMKSWINKNNIYLINQSSLPSRFKKYISDLRKSGYNVSIVYLDNKYNINCFLVIISNRNILNKEMPYIKTGIGSDFSDKEVALDKAFGELLIGLYFDLKDLNWNHHPAKNGLDFHIDFYNSSENHQEKFNMVKHYFIQPKNKIINWDFENQNILNELNKEDIEYINIKPTYLEQYNFQVVRAFLNGVLPLYYKGAEDTWINEYFTIEQSNYLKKHPHPFP